MNFKTDILKPLAGGSVLVACAIGIAIVGGPTWMVVTVGIVAIAMTTANIILSILIWRKYRTAPNLSFVEFGFLYEAWKAARAGHLAVYSDTPAQRRLVDLGLIAVVHMKRWSREGVPSPMGDIILPYSQITPLGERVLIELVRREEGEQAAIDMQTWRPPI